MICGGCGSDARKLRISMTDRNGKLLPEGERKEICQNCVPEDFHAPCDPLAKVVFEHEAHPNLYHYKPDGSLELNDSPKGDLMAEMYNTRDEDEALARKRANRRTTPMTAEEIQAADAMMRPLVQAYLADVKEQEKADLDYTEKLVEKYVREDHDRQLQESVN